jgi:chromosomal replication initiation ATPase DnaA
MARTIPIRALIEGAARLGQVPVHLLFAPDRRRRTARARWLFMLVARDHFHLSYPAIGAHLGGMDHTSVMHGVRQARLLCAANTDFADRVRAMTALATWLAVPSRQMIAADIGLIAFGASPQRQAA